MSIRYIMEGKILVEFLPSIETVRVTFRFLMALDLNSYRILLMAATISTLELGRGTSQEPMNCCR